MRARSLAFASLILGTACTADGSAPSALHPSVETVKCPADVETVVLKPHSCGYLTVLEDRTRLDGPTIKLFYMRVQPTGVAVEREPLAAVGYEIAQPPNYEDIVGITDTSKRELILMDQRGTGHSEPSLACPEVEAISSDLLSELLSSSAVRNTLREAVTACRSRLAEAGIDTDAYTLTAAAQDLEDLRIALGVPSWNLISWGSASRVLLEYVREYPEPSRSLVLSSPQFPERDAISEAAGEFADAFRAVAGACAASNECGRRYPDLQRTLSEAVSALQRSPVSVNVQGGEVVVDGVALVRVVRDLISSHDAEAQGKVARIVHAALHGSVRAVASELTSDPGICIGYLPLCEQPVSLGAYLSFTCPDSSPPTRSSKVYARPLGKANPYWVACDAWGTGRGARNATPVVTNVPSLILRGEYDAFSPLDLVRRVETNMPNAHVVLVPRFGHDVFGVACLRDARNEWLMAPQGDPVYSDCLRTIPVPTFAPR
jgi:pimeloyl-ACP methyl ester carboxylesterase